MRWRIGLIALAAVMLPAAAQVPPPLTSAHAAECARLAESGDAGAARECQQRLDAEERKQHDATAP